MGCFEDNENKPKGKFVSFQMNANNSPKRCMNLCNTLQLKYAVLKGYLMCILILITNKNKCIIVYSNVCECKNNEPNYNLKKNFGDCKTLCQGSSFEYCGGSNTSSIYKTLYSGIRNCNKCFFLLYNCSYFLKILTL